MTIEFEYLCKKHEIDRKYIKYLPNLYFVVVMLKMSDMSFTRIAEIMNQKYKIYGGDFTYSRIKNYYHLARMKIIEIKRYAELFDIENNIDVASFKSLNDRLDKIFIQIQKEKEDGDKTEALSSCVK